MAEREPSTQRQIETVYRVGLAIGAVLMAVGLVWALVAGERALAPVDLGGLLGDASTADRVIATGVLVLCLTPGAVVVFLVVHWWRERDYRFVVTGCVVIAVLVLAVILGRG